MTVVRRYAMALCAARRSTETAWQHTRRAWDIYEDASLDDKRRLDTIKRIMEIDTDTISVAVVLQRAEEYDAG